jgi:hypothetical protein
MTDLAGSLFVNPALTFQLRNHQGKLARMRVDTGDEIQNLSHPRCVFHYFRARLRIHVEVPLSYQALGWEKKSLSGSSPLLHGPAPWHRGQANSNPPTSPENKTHQSNFKSAYLKSFSFHHLIFMLLLRYW